MHVMEAVIRRILLLEKTLHFSAVEMLLEAHAKAMDLDTLRDSYIQKGKNVEIWVSSLEFPSL